MSKTYKVWIEVEEYDSKTGERRDVGPDIGILAGEFTDRDVAVAFAKSLDCWKTDYWRIKR